MATLQEITDDILLEVTAANGPDVQTYLQPRIHRKVQRLFNRVFNDRFWFRHRGKGTYTLDGTTGSIVGDTSALIKDFSDIAAVFFQQFRNPLPLVPWDNNPANITQYCIQANYANTTKGYFNVLPVTTAGAVTILYRTKPADFADSSDVPFDKDYIVCKVVGEILADDGVNMTAAQRFLKEAEEIKKELLAQEQILTKSLYSSQVTNVDNWNTR